MTIRGVLLSQPRTAGFTQHFVAPNLLESTLVVVVGPAPFKQLDWPLPLRPVKAADYLPESNLLETTLFGKDVMVVGKAVFDLPLRRVPPVADYHIPANLLSTTLRTVGQFTLLANNGTYAVGGSTAALLRTALLNAATGAYVVSGKTAGLAAGRVLNATSGSYTLSGKALTALRTALLQATGGAYVVNGASATFIHTTGGSGSATSQLYIDLNNGHLIWKLL